MRREGRKSAEDSAGEEVRFRSPLDARGFTMLWNVVLMDERISDGALRTYLVLCFHARQETRCWPGQKVLAQERGCSERAIQRHVAELDDLGLITIERRGKQQSNLYWIEDVRDAYAPPPAETAAPEPLPARPSDATKMAGHPRSDATKMAGHSARDTTKTSSPKKKNQPSEENSTDNNNKATPPPAAAPVALVVVAPDLIEKLTGAGVTRSVAESLARDFPAERIERHIAQLPHRKADEPGAVLVKAIREDWASPAGWSRAEKERRKREQQAEKERERQAAAEAARAEKAAHEARAAALWESLPDAERAALNARAEAAAREKPHLAAMFAKRPDSPMIQGIIANRRQELLAEMLAARESGAGFPLYQSSG